MYLPGGRCHPKLVVLTLGVMCGRDRTAESLTSEDRRPSDREPLAIAHRGASGYLHEHTFAGYALANDRGA